MKNFRYSTILFLALFSGAAHATEKKYNIGLQLYAVRDACEKDFKGTIQEVAKIGFTGVEFAGYYGYSAKEIRGWLDAFHLKCYGTHTQLSDLMGDKFLPTVEFNKTLGNKLIVVPWIPENMRNTKAKIIETGKMFSEMAARLKKLGMQLGFHDHAAEFQKVDGEYPWVTFFSNTSKDVLIQFDTGNAMSAGAQAAPFLKMFPGRIVSVHAKDFSATNPNALLGEGDVNWKDVIPLWKSKNGPKYFIIEQETYPFPSLVCAKKCRDSLLDMLGVKR